MSDLDVVVCDATAILGLRRRALLAAVLQLPLGFAICDVVFHLELGELGEDDASLLKEYARVTSLGEEDFEIVQGLAREHQDQSTGALFSLRLAQKLAAATLLTGDHRLVTLARKYRLATSDLDWAEGLVRSSSATGIRDLAQRKKTWDRVTMEDTA